MLLIPQVVMVRSWLRVCCVACLLAAAACGSDDQPAAETAAQRAEYAAVAQIIGRSCAKQTCHGFLSANVHLSFMQDDFRSAVVGVPSCEYSEMSRVEPGDPEHSWVMIKLAGPVKFRQYANFVDFKPDPAWHPTTPDCAGGSFDDGSTWFGTQMPPPDTTSISADEIAAIRAWIADGAPGP